MTNMATLVNDPTANWIISPGEKAVPGTIVGQILDPESPEGEVAQRIYDLDLCHECGVRKSAINWGDSLAMLHGTTSRRCEVCAYTAQLGHAWSRTLAIPKIVLGLGRAYLLDKLSRNR